MGDPRPNIGALLGRLISQLRQSRGMSMEELADRAGLHRTHIGLVERGERSLTIGSAAEIAKALDLSLSELLAMAEKEFDVGVARRTVDRSQLENESILENLTGFRGEWIAQAIENTYVTLDVIDQELVANSSPQVAELVELANLSSMLGNLLSAALAETSRGAYKRNRPHAFPDLLPERAGLPEIEVKTALETNRPKGHLPKPGIYLTFRYILGGSTGEFVRGKQHRGKTPWIWEVRVGQLGMEDFDLSNTPGDSGKTAVIKTTSFQQMARILFVAHYLPYGSRFGPYGSERRPDE